jgi:hypothetical protein
MFRLIVSSVIWILFLGILLLLATGLWFLIKVDFKPTPENTPQNIYVVNQWTGRFGITFETSSSTSNAKMLLGKDQNNLDITINDVNGAAYQGKLHLFNASTLDPAQTYYYKFLINEETHDNSGAPYSISTLNLNATPFQGIPLAGRINTTESTCLIYAHLIKNGQTSLPFVDYVASNGTYTINVDYLLDKTTKTPLDPSNSDILIYVECNDGKSGGTVSRTNEAIPNIIVSSNFSVQNYSNELRSFMAGGSVTPTATAIITPTRAPITMTPTRYTGPSATPRVTALPKTGLVEDASPVLIGLLLMLGGFYLRVSLTREKY